MKVNKVSDCEWTNFLGLCVPIDDGRGIAVQIPKQPNPLGTIVHESVHVWQKMMQYMQEDSPGIETEAYTIELIVLELACKYQALTGENLAVYDPRKARLQKRSRQIYKQTGSNQEENGTECSPQRNDESGESL